MPENDIVSGEQIKKGRRQLLKGGVGAAIGSTIAGCSSGDDEDEGTATKTDSPSGTDRDSSDNTLNIALEEPIRRLAPTSTLSLAELYLMYFVWEPLITYNNDLEIIPHIATDWETSNGGSEYIFHLRDDVTFHDGKPMTAEDVAFSFKFIKDYPGFIYGPYANIIGDGVVAEDEYTVRVPLEAPTPAFEIWTAEFSSILQKNKWENVDNPGEKTTVENPISTSPYILEDREREQFLEFSVWEDYWGKDPEYDRIIIEIIRESETRALKLGRRELDLFQVNPGPRVDSLGGREGIETPTVPSTFIHHFLMNTANNPLNEKAVRKAIAYAVNRELLRNSLWAGYVDIADSPVPPTLEPFYNPELPQYKFDQDRAKSLLEENGYVLEDGQRLDKQGNPITLDMSTRETWNHDRFATLLKQQIEELGIMVNIEVVSNSEQSSKVYRNKDYDLAPFTYITTLYPSVLLKLLFHPEGPLYAVGNNWRGDEFGAELDNALLSDIDESKESWHRAQEIFVEDLPSYPVAVQPAISAVNGFDWTNLNPILKYGMFSPYGHEPGQGPLTQMRPR